jgi:hypothetical protein
MHRDGLMTHPVEGKQKNLSTEGDGEKAQKRTGEV